MEEHLLDSKRFALFVVQFGECRHSGGLGDGFVPGRVAGAVS